jgi:TolB-like protein
MSGLKLLIDEMKRRRVFRVAVVYAAVAFVIWQAADFVLPAPNVPDWVSTVVVVLTLLGFPIALVLAWALEIAPEGIRPTEPVAGQAVTGRSRGKFSPGPAALIAAFVVLAAFGAWFLALRDSGPTLVRERIAVVPFENRTGDPAQEQLGGMAAEWIATGLAQAGIFEVVPMRIVNQRLEESASGDELRDLADYTQSGTLVTGSFYLRGDSIAFRAELLDAQPRTPALLYAVQPASGPAGNPMDAIETVKQRAAGALAQHFRFQQEWSSARRPELYSPPPSLEAYREALKGGDLMRAFRRLRTQSAVPTGRRNPQCSSRSHPQSS